MNALWERGTLVQIRSGMWSMETSLDAEDIDKQDDEIPNFVNLGSKRLFPKDVRNRFTRIPTRARSMTNRFGFDFFLTGAYFVPNSALEGLLPELEKLQTQFYEEVETFTQRYDTARISFLNEYPDHRGKLEPYYPPVEDVRSRFYMNVWCYKVTSSAIPVGQFAELNDDIYVNWATDAVNSLRQEAIGVANDISKSIRDDTLTGKNLQKVNTLIKRLVSLDLVEDSDLVKAARNVSIDRSLNATDALKIAAAPVSVARIRKLL